MRKILNFSKYLNNQNLKYTQNIQKIKPSKKIEQNLLKELSKSSLDQIEYQDIQPKVIQSFQKGKLWDLKEELLLLQYSNDQKLNFFAHFNIAVINSIKTNLVDMNTFQKSFKILEDIEIEHKNFYLMVHKAIFEKDPLKAMAIFTESINQAKRSQEIEYLCEFLMIDFNRVYLNGIKETFNEKDKLIQKDNYIKIIQTIEYLQNPNFLHEEIYYNYANILLEEGNREGAHQYLKKSYTLCEYNINKVQDNKDKERCQKIFENTCYYLSSIYLESNNESECLKYLKKLEELSVKPNFTLNMNYSMIYFQNKKYQLALDYIEKIKDLELSEKEHLNVQYQLLKCYIFAKQFNEAQELFEKVVGLYKNSPFLNIEILYQKYLISYVLSGYLNHSNSQELTDGMFYYVQDKYLESINILEQISIELSSSIPKVYLDLILSICYINMKQERYKDYIYLVLQYLKEKSQEDSIKDKELELIRMFHLIIQNIEGDHYIYRVLNDLFNIIKDKESPISNMILFQQAKYELEMSHYENAIEKFKFLIEKFKDDPIGKMECYINLAIGYDSLPNKKECQMYLDLGLEIAKSIGDQDTIEFIRNF